MVERQQIHQRPEVNLASPLRDRRQKDTRRRRASERRRMMLRKVIAVKSRRVGRRDQLQTFLVQRRQRNVASL